MGSVYGGGAPSPHRAGECMALAAADDERGSLKVVTNQSLCCSPDRACEDGQAALPAPHPHPRLRTTRR
eukprot:scaffold19553_cov94-Isochrysis_galbana.AAC.3